MEQVKSFCRRYRRLLLAAAYLAIFAVGVLYLRVTVNIPPEGDDKLTLNLWLYDFQRMPFWQYALQDMQGRLRYFTLQEVRFFPFHYPNAVDLLFYTSLTHYRLYIIAWTGAAAFAVSRVAARLGSGDALALGGFALALAAAAVLTGRCPRGAPILVQLPGGTLEVCVQRDDTVLLTGDAAATFSGTVLIQPCKAPRGVV